MQGDTVVTPRAGHDLLQIISSSPPTVVQDLHTRITNPTKETCPLG